MANQVYEEYCIGVLTENVVNTNKTISFWPADKVPVLPKRELVSTYFNAEEYGFYQHKGVDSQGRSYEANVKADTSMRAEYLNDDRNQISIPMLRVGERVQIYRLKGSEGLFWKPLNIDGRLGESDSVVKAYAATNKDKPGAANGDPEQSYVTSFSPLNKEISIVTSQANGEPCGYVVQLNTKDGAMLIQDTLGNIIQLSSVEKRITLRNADDTYMDLNKQDFEFHCHGNAKFTVGGNLEWNVTGDKQTTVGGNHVESISGNSEVSCPEMKTTSSHIGVECPTTDVVGMVNMGGMSTTGDGGDGNAQLKGGLKAEKDVVASGSISLTHHTHLEQGDGRDTSQPH